MTSRRLFRLLAFVCLLIAPGGAASETISGRVSGFEGDTIRIDNVSVRIEALFCPGKGEPGGWMAEQRMSSVVDSGAVDCLVTERLAADFLIGRCVVDGRDIAERLIEEGACARCARFDPEGRYAEAEARAGRRALWAPPFCEPDTPVNVRR